MTRKSSNHPMQQADTRGRKRAASQAIALPTTTKRLVPASVQLRNEISFDDRIDDFDEESDRSSSESDEENETSIPTSVLVLGIGKKTRSFAGIPGIYQGITNTTRKIVEHYTLYKKPLLTLGEILLLIQNAWARAQTECRYLERVSAVDIYLKSIRTRTRAHLVAECHSHITKIYGINHLSKDAMKEKVEYLLDGDRFICRRAKREKYFEGRKRKGNREPNFLEKINGVFICLVATAIRHCLKAWRTGKCADSVQEFKYETAWLTYERISKTWASHGPRVQELIVSNVKADLSRQIAAHVKIVEIEPTDAPQLEDQGVTGEL
ncbi:hypothetical protein BGX38DRAFT_1273858 [Terfezia claveryi]|nr:hypothetical protein BGX38DRAFT_1273858 [Terfezia claveryi]